MSPHRLALATTLTALVVGCGARPGPRPAAPPPATDRGEVDDRDAELFWANLRALCGLAFAGAVVEDRGGDGADPFDGEPLVMHVRECSDSEIRVPFHVGTDRSRTWVFTRTRDGLRLEHDHRHADGTPAALTMYGGDTIEAGTASEQAFPADARSREMFVRHGKAISVTNVWVIGFGPGGFTYALTRPGREVRVAFDLIYRVAPPPPPWGAKLVASSSAQRPRAVPGQRSH